MTAPLVRVLVVDDHPIVLDGVTMAVQHTSWLQVTGYARTGREAVVAVNALRPDVVLLDLRLPDMLGSEAVQPIRRSNPAVKIILFTAYPDHAAVEAALAAGVDGVVVKDTEREALIDVIRRVMAGERVVQVDYDDAALVSRKLREHGLTRRQYDILRHVAMGETNPEIAAALVLSVHTVIRHANHIFAKLGVANRTEAAAYAHRHGLA